MFCPMLGTDVRLGDGNHSEVQGLACPRSAYRHPLAEFWAPVEHPFPELGVFTKCLWKNGVSDLLGLLRASEMLQG